MPQSADSSDRPKTAWDNRALFSITWPLIVEQILAVTMGALDTVMVSSVGEAAVSGVNIVDNINNLLIIAFAALATGGAVVVSQYIGRGDRDSANLSARQLVYCVFAVSICITAIALVFRRPIIGFIYGRLDQNVMDAASIYLLITSLSFPALGLYNGGVALFRAAGNTKITMRIALFVNFLNICGNAVLIYGFKLGVAGAAISTLCCRTIAAFIVIVLLIRTRRGAVNLTGLFKIKLARGTIRRILNVGLPAGIENSMFQVGRLLTQRIFPTFGTAAIAGNAIASVINSFSFTTGMAYGMVLMTVTGQCVGAGDFAGAKRNCGKIMKVSYLTMFVTNALILIFTDPLVDLFNLSGESHRAAALFLRVHCVSMTLGWPTSFALPNALRAAGDGRYVMIAASISMWTVRVSAAYFLCYVVKTGPIGVWLAMGADFAVRSVCYVSRWLGGKWQTKKVI